MVSEVPWRCPVGLVAHQQSNPVVMEHPAFGPHHPGAVVRRDDDARHAAGAGGQQVAENESVHARFVGMIGGHQVGTLGKIFQAFDVDPPENKLGEKYLHQANRPALGTDVLWGIGQFLSQKEMKRNCSRREAQRRHAGGLDKFAQKAFDRFWCHVGCVLQYRRTFRLIRRRRDRLLDLTDNPGRTLYC